MVSWCKQISVSPAVCHGKAYIRATGVAIDNIAAGISPREILQSYPVLQDSDIDAALAYAAELAREGCVDLALEIRA